MTTTTPKLLPFSFRCDLNAGGIYREWVTPRGVSVYRTFGETYQIDVPSGYGPTEERIHADEAFARARELDAQVASQTGATA